MFSEIIPQLPLLHGFLELDRNTNVTTKNNFLKYIYVYKF